MEVEILNTVMQSLLDQISFSYGNLLPVAYYLLVTFATLNFTKIGLSYAFGKSSDVIVDLLLQTFKLGLIYWVISTLPYLHEVLRDTAIKIGMKAAGTSGAVDIVLNPSQVVSYSFQAIRPIEIWLATLSWSPGSIGSSLASSLVGSVSMLIIIGSFAYMAIQVFMTIIDFYLSSVLASIFLAFKVFGPTSWIAESSIKWSIQHAVKLFTISFIISLTPFWISAISSTDKVNGLSGAICIALAALVLAVLTVKAGSFAAGIFSGSPTASAGDLMTTAGGIGAIGVGSAVVANRGMNAAGEIGVRTASAASGAIIGGQAAAARYSGGSMIGRSIAFGSGAIRGAATSTSGSGHSKDAQNRIIKGFSAGNKDSGGGSSSAYSKNKQMYTRIGKAFREQQDFNKK